MVQTFNPAKVMLADSLGKEIINAEFTQEFLRSFISTSRLVQLGDKVDIGNSRMKRFSDGAGSISDAYFVGEGEKIGTANLEGSDYVIETKKIAVILPVTGEYLKYTWRRYFDNVVPAIVDKFNRKIDGASFLGLHNNPFGANVMAAAIASGNVVEGDLTASNIIDLRTSTKRRANAFVGHEDIERELLRLNGAIAPQVGQLETISFEEPETETGTGRLDRLPYAPLNLADLDADESLYPAGTLFAGNFNSLKYAIPGDANLRLKVADQATLSTIQNAGPDSGDVHMFEQDMQALRAIFEIGVAIPANRNNNFAVLRPEVTEA